MKQAYFNWSSGKDSALALHKAMLSGEYHSFVYDGPIFTQPVQFSAKGRYHIDYTDDKTGRKSSYSYLEIH